MRYFNWMKYKLPQKIALAIILFAFVTGTIFFVLRIQRHRSAERILNKMAAVYKNCKSYQDSGTTQMTPPWIGTLKFTTTFIRPNHFRYEHTAVDGVDNRYLAWRSSAKIAAWSSLEPLLVKDPESFNMAIAYGTGSSMTAAHTIPALLFSKDEISGWRLNDMIGATQISDAKIGNTECFRVKGRVGVFNTVVWIDKSTFLVLKIERVNNKGVTTVTKYNPVINAKIPDTAMEYNITLRQRRLILCHKSKL